MNISKVSIAASLAAAIQTGTVMLVFAQGAWARVQQAAAKEGSVTL